MPPQQFGGATVRTQVGLVEHSPCQNLPSLWRAWICFVASNFSSEASAQRVSVPLQALGVGTKEVPHGTDVALRGRQMDVHASGITVTERARLSTTGIAA